MKKLNNGGKKRKKSSAVTSLPSIKASAHLSSLAWIGIVWRRTSLTVRNFEAFSWNMGNLAKLTSYLGTSISWQIWTQPKTNNLNDNNSNDNKCPEYFVSLSDCAWTQYSQPRQPTDLLHGQRALSLHGLKRHYFYWCYFQ